MRCFEGFVSSRNSLIINFGQLSRLGAILARQFARKTVEDLVGSSEHIYSHPDWLKLSWFPSPLIIHIEP